ncbi:glycine zipper 2TM domain-containing protein [Alphaproteobacteria bacterium]|nr:glycine zipper 2TM domain-containing protein [Alphaproteobacteria bacterium]
MGAVTGAVAGGLLGNSIGKGDGRVASTAIGTFLGTIVGSEVGKSMDRPRTVVYRTQSAAPSAYGVCAHITNEGARASCKKGVADRLRQEQRRMERDAYNRGYRR